MKIEFLVRLSEVSADAPQGKILLFEGEKEGEEALHVREQNGNLLIFRGNRLMYGFAQGFWREFLFKDVQDNEENNK